MTDLESYIPHHSTEPKFEDRVLLQKYIVPDIDNKKYRESLSQKNSLCFGIEKCDCKKFSEVVPKIFEKLILLKRCNQHFGNLLLKYAGDFDFFWFMFQIEAHCMQLNKTTIPPTGISKSDLTVISSMLVFFDIPHCVDAMFSHLINSQIYKHFFQLHHKKLTKKEKLPIAKEWSFCDHLEYMLDLLKAYYEKEETFRTIFIDQSEDFPPEVHSKDGTRVCSAYYLRYMYVYLFEGILPILVSAIPLVLTGDGRVIEMLLTQLLQLSFVVNATHYRKAILLVLNRLVFLRNNNEPLYNYIVKNFCQFNSMVIEYIHSTVELLVKNNVVKSLSQIHVVLRNLSVLQNCRMLVEDFLGLTRKNSYHAKYVVKENHLRAASEVITKLFHECLLSERLAIDIGWISFRCLKKHKSKFPPCPRPGDTGVRTFHKRRVHIFIARVENNRVHVTEIRIKEHSLRFLSEKKMNNDTLKKIFEKAHKVSQERKTLVIDCMKKLNLVRCGQDSENGVTFNLRKVFSKEEIVSGRKGKEYPGQMRREIVEHLDVYITTEERLKICKCLEIRNTVKLTWTKEDSVKYIRSIRKVEKGKHKKKKDEEEEEE